VNYSVEELIRACVETGHADAWEEFMRRFHGVIASTVIRTARGAISAAAIDQLIQDTYLKIWDNRRRVLREVQTQGQEAILGLLKTIASSVTMDYFCSIRGREARRRWSLERNILFRQIVAFRCPGLAQKFKPNCPEAIFNRAVVCQRMFLYEEALEEWQRYLELYPHGDWAEEAKRRLAKIKQKLRQHRTRFRIQ
jgi:tetratricopeptide (TPR) repeat protein